MNRNQIEAFTARWIDAICQGNLSQLEELLSPSVLDLNTGQQTTRAPFRERARVVHDAFEALEGRVDELLVDGDRIAWRWTLSGQQRAPFLGELALGRRITLKGTNFQRLEAGLVVAHFTLVDALDVVRQMRAAT